MNNVPENLTKIQIMVICVQSKISMSYDSEDFVTRQQWGYFEFTPMFISMFNPNVHHNVHPNVHSNVHPNVHPNSQTSPFIIPVSSVCLPGWKSTFFQQNIDDVHDECWLERSEEMTRLNSWTFCCRSIPSPSWLLAWIWEGFKSQTFPINKLEWLASEGWIFDFEVYWVSDQPKPFWSRRLFLCWLHETSFFAAAARRLVPQQSSSSSSSSSFSSSTL